jgi:hypothetical protein
MNGASEDFIEPPITDLPTLVGVIRDECLDYQLWEDDPHADEPLETAFWHLRGRVQALQGFFPPLGQLPGEGQDRWRELQETKPALSEGNHVPFFRALDGFLRWLTTEFNFNESEVAPESHPCQPNAASLSPTELTEAERQVYEVIGSEPLKGAQIAVRCEKSYDAVRQILPRLRRYGLIRNHENGGYVRA